MKRKAKKRMLVFLLIIILLVAVKVVWVKCATSGQGSWDGEKKDIIRRANYLTAKVATSPQALLDEMPSGIGVQFRGEWALYSCSMTCAAGPIILNYSPSGTGFALGAATSLGDTAFRKKLLSTIEIGGSTITWFSKTHYMVSDLAVVAEAILLAMRTSAPETILTKK